MEWLKDILGEELYSQVSVKLTEKNIKIANLSDGSYLPRDKFNEVNNEKKLLKEQIEEYKKKSVEVDKLVSSNQELKNQLDNLNNDFNTKLIAKDNEIELIGAKSYVEKELMNEKAIYPEAIMATLDFSKIKKNGDKYEGFNINEVKTKFSKMFETVQTTGNVTNPGNANPLTGNTSNLSKKQQLINKYNEAAEKRDVIAMQRARMEIQSLKQNE